jgi:hypothetical protein
MGFSGLYASESQVTKQLAADTVEQLNQQLPIDIAQTQTGIAPQVEHRRHQHKRATTAIAEQLEPVGRTSGRVKLPNRRAPRRHKTTTLQQQQQQHRRRQQNKKSSGKRAVHKTQPSRKVVKRQTRKCKQQRKR